MRWSSVATTTSLAPAASARRATCTTIGSPAISRSGLPGRREASWRAGMATMNSGAGMHFLQALGDGGVELLGQLRFRRHHPGVGEAERAAFYAVLLGHQDRAALHRQEVGALELVVVGEGVPAHVEAQRA